MYPYCPDCFFDGDDDDDDDSYSVVTPLTGPCGKVYGVDIV